MSVDDQIEQLLLDADRSARSAAAMPAGFSARVMTRIRRRQQMKRGMAMAALMTAGVIGLAVVQINRQRQVVVASDQMSRLSGEIAEQERLVQTLSLQQQAADRLAASRQRLADVQAPGPEQIAMERAATAVLTQGDRLSNLAPDRAAATYRRVMTIFPETPAAAEARKRLANSQKDG